MDSHEQQKQKQKQKQQQKQKQTAGVAAPELNGFVN